MGNIDTIKANISNVQNNITIYEKEIEEIQIKISSIVSLLKDNESIPANLNISLMGTLSKGVSDFSSLELSLLSVESKILMDDIIDYSVTANNLRLKESITINGKTVNIYVSGKTKALYVISDNLGKNDRALLRSTLKNHLSNNQMAIVTYHNDYYTYDIKGIKKCTSDYDVVGKTKDGKMYAFVHMDNSELVTDNGTQNDTLLTIVNGMVVSNRMCIVMEKNTELKINVKVKDNISGGQVVTEYERLSFSAGKSASTGGEYAHVEMEGNWQKYANTKENRANGTWINENNNNNVVIVGDGPKGSYKNRYRAVGHVNGTMIPLVIISGNRQGEQHMQGTVCYHHDGIRPGWSSKDMLSFSQKIVSEW